MAKYGKMGGCDKPRFAKGKHVSIEHDGYDHGKHYDHARPMTDDGMEMMPKHPNFEPTLPGSGVGGNVAPAKVGS